MSKTLEESHRCSSVLLTSRGFHVADSLIRYTEKSEDSFVQGDSIGNRGPNGGQVVPSCQRT